MPEAYLQLGAVAVLFAVAIREFFSYLKSKQVEKNGTGKFDALILQELRTTNTNHLHDLKDVLEKGNYRLVDVIHADNTKMIELLGEIKGTLNNKN